jgi:hypothetical protein
VKPSQLNSSEPSSTPPVVAPSVSPPVAVAEPAEVVPVDPPEADALPAVVLPEAESVALAVAVSLPVPSVAVPEALPSSPSPEPQPIAHAAQETTSQLTAFIRFSSRATSVPDGSDRLGIIRRTLCVQAYRRRSSEERGGPRVRGDGRATALSSSG